MEWALLAPLQAEERTRVMNATRSRDFSKGEVILHEGDPADSLHLVASGRLAVRVSNRNGETVTLNVLVPGDFFGELALIRPGAIPRRTATVFCLEPARTLSLSSERFHALCDGHPEIAHLVEAALASRIENLSARLLETLFDGLDRRVMHWLYRLSKVYGGADSAAVIPLTQGQLADLVGGTRPSVNQVLTRLASQGVIEVGRGRVVILDLATLRRKAGEG